MGLSSRDAYDILELPEGADQDSIRTSYKRLSLKWHPDKHQNSTESLKHFKGVSKSYKRLSTDEYDSDDDMVMNLEEMYEQFEQVFFSKTIGNINGYDTSDEDDDDDDDEDDDDDDIGYNKFSIFPERCKSKQSKKNKGGNDVSTRKLTEVEIAKNAQELVEEEEKEKRRVEKRRAKKKRRRDRKRLEKQSGEQKKDEKSSNSKNDDVQEKKNKSNKKKNDKKCKESSESDEESFDANAAFFTKVVNKKKKGHGAEQPQSGKKDKKDRDTNNADDVEELDPVVLRSRQLAIRGNEMAQLSRYTTAIELFSEAITLDPADFRFFGNRSYCYDRITQYEKALRDADRAITLKPDWPKGYFRKGRALAGLKLYADAEQAFMQVLKLDRNCEDATQELLRVRTHQLTEMGFSRAQAEAAIHQFSTVQLALDSLLAGVVAETNMAGEFYVSDEEDYTPEVMSAPSTSVTHQVVPRSSPQPIVVTQQATPKASDVKMDPKNPEGLTALWVGNVLPEVNEKKLTQMFSKYGNVTSVRCLPEKYCAFVNFKSKESAGKAMHSLQGNECAGQRLLIKFPDNPICNGNQVVLRKNTSQSSTVSTSSTASKQQQLQQQQQQQQQQQLQQQKQQQLLQQQQQQQQQQQLEQMELQEQQDARNAIKQTGPVNGDECYFWRTTGCIYGDKCHYKHLPQHKGIDKKPWQRVK